MYELNEVENLALEALQELGTVCNREVIDYARRTYEQDLKPYKVGQAFHVLVERGLAVRLPRVARHTGRSLSGWDEQFYQLAEAARIVVEA